LQQSTRTEIDSPAILPFAGMFFSAEYQYQPRRVLRAKRRLRVSSDQIYLFGARMGQYRSFDNVRL